MQTVTDLKKVVEAAQAEAIMTFFNNMDFSYRWTRWHDVGYGIIVLGWLTMIGLALWPK